MATKWLKQNGIWVRGSDGRGIVGPDGCDCCGDGPLCGRWVILCVSGSVTEYWGSCDDFTEPGQVISMDFPNGGRACGYFADFPFMPGRGRCAVPHFSQSSHSDRLM